MCHADPFTPWGLSSGTKGGMPLAVSFALLLAFIATGPCPVENGAAYVVLRTTGLAKHLIGGSAAHTETAGFGGAMSRCGKDNELCMWKDFFNSIGIGKRANHIIAPMNHRNGNVFKGG